MSQNKQPHEGHENHMCTLKKEGYTLENYLEHARDAKFVCKGCWRVAAKKENLCDPIPIPE